MCPLQVRVLSLVLKFKVKHKGEKMKLIQAMKQIKDLQIKADDLKKKAATYCAIQNVETPLYGTEQSAKIKEWIQGYSDIVKEILRLRVAIQRTNLNTNVTIELGGIQVTKSIAEWIHRRRDLAKMEQDVWLALTDRGLKEGLMLNSQQEKVEVKIVRFYDAAERDRKSELYRSEPSIIDSTLETVNAVTDLIV
jgi:hypothetical protein